MQGIEFEEDKDIGGIYLKNAPEVVEKKPSYMMRLLEKAGVTDPATGNLILLGIAIVFFGVTIFIYAGILGDNMPSSKTAEQISTQLKVLKEMQNIK